ncbi:MAG: ammonia-forming cytochrome c nitrite reductase subunit c552 [Blautia sp.]|nr:ammonia-forming cytochrome c nitrite reductase subunit c552 [Blautia sp.]
MKRVTATVCVVSAAMFFGAALYASAAETPVPAGENGIITADEWEEVYPELVQTYRQNEENTYRISYLDTDPYLANIYEGYGFAFDYTSAVGHSYCLEDVYNTERPHPLANCLTCKTADFTKMVNDLGEEVYSYDFQEVYSSMNESVGCYNCHANEEAAGEDNLTVTHSYITLALGEDHDGIDPRVLACGQCHIEYYFDPETKATRMPHADVAGMGPEATLAYYDEMDFADWTQESTGTRMLKAQHPEMETFLDENSIHNKMGLTCADCHMGSATATDGTTFVNHYWRSPLEDEALLETCAACHKDTDMTVKVHKLQAEITGVEKMLGKRLSLLKDTLADAVQSGLYSEEELNEIRSLYRSAQWYWDYCYVENSEGAHNSTFARNCLYKSQDLIQEAMDKLEAMAA